MNEDEVKIMRDVGRILFGCVFIAVVLTIGTILWRWWTGN